MLLEVALKTEKRKVVSDGRGDVLDVLTCTT